MDDMSIPTLNGTAPTASWRYFSPDGDLCFVVVRYDTPDGKEIRPYYPEGDRLLAGLPDFQGGERPLLAAVAFGGWDVNEPVYITEGERCAGALLNLGYQATTSSGGSQAPRNSDWSGLGRFREIIIMPDRDEPGRKYAEAVAEILNGLPGSRSVKSCNLPGLPDKGDVVDLLRSWCPGWDGFSPFPDDDLPRLRGLLDDAIATCSAPWPPPGAVSMTGDAWPDPVDIKSALPPVEPFQLEFLPESLRGWVGDIAHRLQSPVEFAAGGALTVAGALIGRQLGIRPKMRDNWVVVPNLWCALIGPPSAMKSPSLAQVRKPLDKLDGDAVAEHAGFLTEWKRKAAIAEARGKSAKKKLQRAVDKEDSMDCDIEEAAHGLVTAEENPPPPCRRYYTSDSTTEKIIELMRDTPRGILVMRDELVSWLKSLDRSGREGDRGFYCECWNGIGAFAQDRIGRGTIRTEACCGSVLGCSTPGAVQRYVAECLADSDGGDGFLQRFQIALWPDISETWQNVDAWPDSEARDRAYSALFSLDKIDLQAVGAERDKYDQGDGIPFLRFTPDAQDLWDDWYSGHMRRLRCDTSELGALLAHMGKMQKTVAGIALIGHLLDNGGGPVAHASLAQALAWAELLESHARRLYGSGLSESMGVARRLWLKIERGNLQSEFTVRDVRQKHWAGMESEDTVKAALKELESLGYVRERIARTGGRPRVSYTVNPKTGVNHG